MVYPKLINRKSLCFQTLVSLATTVPENDVVYMMRLPKNSTPDAWVPSQSSGCPAWIAAWQWGGGLISDFSIQRPWASFFFFKLSFPTTPPFLATPQGMWDLSSWPGTEPVPPAVKVRSLYWSAGEVPKPWTFEKWVFLGRFSSAQSLSCVQLFVTPWTAARQASLSITNCRSLPKPMFIVLVMPSNHLIFCCPLLLLPSIFPSIRFFSNESALCIRWPKYWSFSFNISTSNEHPGLICLEDGLVGSPGSPRDSQESSPTP